MIKTNKIYSAYIISAYSFLIGFFLLFHDAFNFSLDYSEVSQYIIKERAVYYIATSILFLQIYIASVEFYVSLINTLSVIFLLFMFIQPLNDILYYPVQVWLLSSVNLFLIILMQTERYYYR
tara:strand:- start:152 stop:517 length:366 start_codon:yes stop_codon:yes gene_type:complete